MSYLLKLVFYFRNKLCFSLRARKLLVSSTFLPLSDYSDLLFMGVSNKCLQALITVYHCALRVGTGCWCLTHHCTLYAKSDWPSLNVRRNTHWLTFICKTFLVLFLHISLRTSKEPKAIIPYVVFMFFNCLSLSWGKEHSALLPPLCMEHTP